MCLILWEMLWIGRLAVRVESLCRRFGIHMPHLTSTQLEMRKTKIVMASVSTPTCTIVQKTCKIYYLLQLFHFNKFNMKPLHRFCFNCSKLLIENFLNPIIELNVENIMIMMDLPIVIIFTCFNLAGTSNWYNHWMYNRHGPTVVLIRIQPWTCLKFVKRSVGLNKEERHISDLDSKKKAWKWIYMHAELIIKPGAEI